MGRILIAVLVLLFSVEAWAADPSIPTKNVNIYGGAQAAVTAVGSGYANLLINDVQKILSGNSITFGPNTQLMITPGSGVSVSTGASVYFLGPIIAGPYQLVWGNGASVFGQEATNGYYRQEWDGKSGTSGIFDGTLSRTVTTGVSTTSDITSSGTITGGFFRVNLTSSETLSGTTLKGASIANYGSTNEVTGTVVPVFVGASFNIEIAGNTHYVIQFNASDSVIGVSNFNSGNSVIFMSGQAGSCFGSFSYLAANKWIASGVSVLTRNK